MKNRTIQNKETLLGVCIRQRDRYLEKSDRENADKMASKILQLKKEIKDLKEDKPAPAPVNQGGAALRFLRSSENLNNNFREIDQVGEEAVKIGLKGGSDALAKVSQGQSAVGPIAGALSKLLDLGLGLFAKHKNTSSENEQEVKVTVEKDRGCCL